MAKKSAQTLDDRETEAKSTVAMTVRAGELIELAEDVLLLIFRNSGPGVAHVDADVIAAMAAAHHHAALSGVAHGVRDQVQQDSFEQDCVAPHPSAARHDAQRQSLFSRGLGKGPLGSIE